MTSTYTITDTLNRPLRDLRISVTDRCNFRCRYCMPEEVFGPNYRFLHNDKLLSFEEITRLARIFASLGVEKIRLTGGEPLLRKELSVLIEMLSGIRGIKDIALTTNGSLLAKQAKQLKDAGLIRINVSLDSLDDTVFSQMNGGRCDVSTIIAGMNAAAHAGLGVKVNMVVQKGINDHHIVAMARYFRRTGYILRFIEYMDVGNSNEWNIAHIVPKQDIMERIHAEMPLEPIPSDVMGQVATRYRYIGTGEEIGIISSVSDSFCSTCTRARISADGRLYTCLFASEGTDLLSPIRSGANDDEMSTLIQNVWSSRFDRYSDERLYKDMNSNKKKIEMSYIGG